MKVPIFVLAAFLSILPSIAQCAPIQDGDRDSHRNINSEPDIEDRRGHRRRMRPCRGRDNDGRTFINWNFHYYDVNYNCGGGNAHATTTNSGGGHGGLFSMLGSLGLSSLPSLLSAATRPGASRPTLPLLNTPGQYAPTTTNGIASASANAGNNQHNSNGGGLFGLGLFDWFCNNNRPHDMHVTVTPPYEEPEKPVSEDYDDVPETLNARPGQYQAANRPAYGNRVQDVTNFNPNRIVKHPNNGGVNNIFGSFFDLLLR